MAAVQYQIIEFRVVDYTPTNGTSNLTLDSCSAYVEINIYLFVSHKTDWKYVSASRCMYAIF